MDWVWWVAGGAAAVALIIAGAKSAPTSPSEIPPPPPKSPEEKKRDLLRSFKFEVEQLLEKHAETLARKKAQLVYEDDYGTPRFDRWEKERAYFIETVIAPAEGRPILLTSPLGVKLLEAIELITANDPAEPGGSPSLGEVKDPFAYEQAVADLLRRDGWDARHTKASGDQGADVLASRAGRRLVVQCKLWSQPVGNKAVQEVFAAKQHERADFAAVVTNSTFTLPARQLAATTGVLLLHHDQLPGLAERLGMT